MATKSKMLSATKKIKRVIVKKTFLVTSLSLPKNIFKKTSFPSAPGGDRYEWKGAETIFEVPKDGLFAIKIEASAKDARKNKGTDDDDLRVALDGFNFGKYEQNQEQISWKGFNTSASWNGATLRGGTKTVYYFVNLNKGSHTLQFFADKTPVLKSIEVFEVKNHAFELQNLRPSENIKSKHNGMPWFSFVFLGLPSKSIVIGAKVMGAKSKGTSDGDNLKVMVNGVAVPNPIAPISDKYKNFYFSGDLKKFDVLTITDKDLAGPLAFENAIELWYDEEPEITSLKINFFSKDEFIDKYNLRDSAFWVKWEIQFLALVLEKGGRVYTADFLKHSLENNPTPRGYSAHDSITLKIKQDPVFLKITDKLKQKILAGDTEGEIWPEDFRNDPGMNGQINFDSFDLKTALHGIKKIEYIGSLSGDGTVGVNFTIFDVYDFQRNILPSLLSDYKAFSLQAIVNWLDRNEELEIIHNFEIQIHLSEKFNAN